MSDRQVAVVSTAQTELRRQWDNAQHVDLIGDVVSRCLEGVGLTLTDVDFVMDSGSDVLDGRSISNCGFLGALGAHHKEESRIEEDGLWAALYGSLKLQAGGGDVGLIVAYSKPSEANVELFYESMTEPFYQRGLGFDQVTASALQASQYLHRRGLSEDTLVGVAARDWDQAARNGHVEIDGDAPDRDTIAASEQVASPLRELTVQRPVDGAVAVLLATEEVARRVTPNPVFVQGIGAAMDEHMLAHRAPGRLDACAAAANMAYRKAGIEPGHEFSLAEISATSTAGELMVLDALSIGNGSPEDCFTDQSAVAVNLSGGAIPASPLMATGLVRLAEAADRLSARTKDPQITDPQDAIVHGTGGLGMQNHCVFMLRREL